MQTDEISSYLDALARDECYRVVRTLKSSPVETTEEVRFVGRNGAEGPSCVRKRIAASSGLGGAYEEIFRAQQSGRRFRFLPRIFDYHVADGEVIVVMEFVSGITLADAVYERDPSVGLAAEVFPQLCDAASELHEGFDPPLIHRDLKPSNVIVGRAGLTIIDFGIARTYREGAATDTSHFGTRAYAPPEQFGFGQTDVRSDVYALGMLLYYCLTEKTPDPQRRREMLADPGVPAALARVIDRATAFDPAARFGSARELKQAAVEAFSLCGPKPCEPGAAPTGMPGASGAPASASQAGPSAADGKMGGKPPYGKSERARFRRFGVAWDVALLAFWALVSAVSVAVTFFPSGDVATWSLASRVLAYFGFMIPVTAGIALLLADKRPLARIAPLRNATRKQYRYVAVALIVFAFACVIVATFIR